MGFSKKEMQKKYKSILEFSELENFIDVPIKNYSSGMYMRLGFAIAIDVNPDILIIDEILAVGDASFQKKCISKIKDFRSAGKTMILVSHNHDIVREFCNRALWLRNGEKVMLDSSERIIYEYLKFLQNKEKQKFEDTLIREEPAKEELSVCIEPPENTIVTQQPAEEKKEAEQVTLPAEPAINEAAAPLPENVPEPEPEKPITRWGSGELVINSVEFFNNMDDKKNVFEVGEDIHVKLKYSTKTEIDSPGFGIQFFREDGRYLHGSSTFFKKVATGVVNGDGTIWVKYKNMPLGAGVYFVTVCATNKDDWWWQNPYDFHHKMYKFMVQDQQDKEQGQVGELFLQHEWGKDSGQ